jgi:NTE family protein
MNLFRARPNPISLALQGGGAHGAFTWGVLDALLEDGRFPITAVSATIAGAMNAVALAHGLCHGGRDAARAALEKFWLSVAASVSLDGLLVGPVESPGFAPATRLFMHWASLLSPLQLNPLGLNPLRDLLAAQIDFERLRRHDAPRLFIAATHANSGRLRLFDNADLDVEAVLASACLPSLQHAVMIDGEPWWDGGYSANPALFPLVREGAPDLLIVMLSPLVYTAVPTGADQIRARALEFTFNSAFLREATLLSESCAAARNSVWPFGRFERRLVHLRTHLIDAEEALSGLTPESRLIAHRPFLEKLRDLGRDRAQRWLATSAAQVGRRSSADLARLFAAPGSGRTRPAPAA